MPTISRHLMLAGGYGGGPAFHGSVFERLGDIRSQAITMGRIADILQRRGDLDEARRIRREEQLPVYEWLGRIDLDEAAAGRPADKAYEQVKTLGAPDDPVAAWLRFGLSRHGRVMVVGFREASIPIDLDRVFVPLYVYADQARMGGGPDAPDGKHDDKEGLSHGGAEISFDDALARASDGRTCLALIGDPGAGKTTLLRHLFRRVAAGEVTGPVAHSPIAGSTIPRSRW